jgi:hypothetical protein
VIRVKNRSAVLSLCAALACAACSDSGSECAPDDQTTEALNFDETTFLESLLAASNRSSPTAQNLSRRELVHLLRRAEAKASRLDLMLNSVEQQGGAGGTESGLASKGVTFPARITIPINAVDGEVSFNLDEEPLYYEYSFANNSDEVVAAPILYDRFIWNSVEGLITSGEFRRIPNETDRALAIWEFVVTHRYHFMPPTSGIEVRDIIKFLSIYGYGFCDTSARTLARLADEVGLQGRIWFLQGHVVPEIKADGRWILLDPELQLYFTDPADPKHIYGVEDLVANPSLFGHFAVSGGSSGPASRPAYQEFPAEWKEFFLSTEDNEVVEQVWHQGIQVKASADYLIEDQLRPGERIAFANFNWGKYFLGNGLEVVPLFYNGYYELQLNRVAAEFATDEIIASKRKDGWHLINRSAAKSSTVALRSRHGFPILGLALLGNVHLIRGESHVVVEDHSNLTRSEFIQPTDGPIVMDSAFSVLSYTPTYEFSLLFELGPNAEILLGTDARLVSEFQFSNLVLAPIKRGLNTLRLHADDAASMDLLLELRYCVGNSSADHPCTDSNGIANRPPGQ